MNDNREHQCIRLAADAKKATLNRLLSNCGRHGFESPVGDISLRFPSPWNFKQILLYPIALVAILALVLLTPLAYIEHLWSRHKYKSELKREIQALDELVQQDPPTTKTIMALWDHCDLRNSALTWDESLELLRNWLAILYSAEMFGTIDVELRAREIARQQQSANRDYYEGRNGPHFLFIPPIESLIQELSFELPPYANAA